MKVMVVLWDLTHRAGGFEPGFVSSRENGAFFFFAANTFNYLE